MDSPPLLEEHKGEERDAGKQVQSLYQACQQLEDGRKARGKHYDLAGILLIIVLATLAGMSSLLAVSDWARDQEEAIRADGNLRWKRMPCTKTSSSVLARLDSQPVKAHLASWLVRQMKQQSIGEPEDHQAHLAIDGKALKRTGTRAYGGEHPHQHLLHLSEADTGVVLQQVPLGSKTNEAGALKPFLTEAIWKGRVLTADAAQRYHAFTRHVKRAGGDVILIIKDTTPVARSDLELFCEDPQADRSSWQSLTQGDKGHGRLERRLITRSPDLHGLFFKDWGESGQAFRLQRECTIKGEHWCQVRYGVPTLALKLCPPQRLLSYLRAHWKVENHLHWQRDATLGEDRCRIRFSPVMEMLAVLKTVVLSLMRLHRVSTVARQLRRFSSHPDEALVWFL